MRNNHEILVLIYLQVQYQKWETAKLAVRYTDKNSQPMGNATVSQVQNQKVYKKGYKVTKLHKRDPLRFILIAPPPTPDRHDHQPVS